MRNNEIFLFNQPRPVRAHASLRRLDTGKIAEQLKGAFGPSFTPLERSGEVSPGTRSDADRYDRLLALQIPPVEHSYGPKDCMLYALGFGLGQDPMNEDELAFVYEKNLKVLPTFALVHGYSPYWLRNPESGVNWTKVVHGERASRCTGRSRRKAP